MLSRWLVGSALVFVTAACGGDPVRWDEGDDMGAGGTDGSAGNANVPAEPAFADEPIECDTTCEAPPGGIDFGCGPRFLYGINYAWLNFGGDFGGNIAYQEGGVVENRDTHLANLNLLREHEVQWVRWWLFPDFRGSAVTFSRDEEPLSISAGALEDVERSLELAARADVSLMLTLFSFNGFEPSMPKGGHWTPSLQPIVLDAQKRRALLENVVRPLARTVEASRYRDRMPVWDVINEPEWAIHGSDDLGDEPFDPMEDHDTVSHAEMELFLAEVIAVLREESSAQVTVGATAMKWKNAWSRLDLDFDQFHTYDWIDRWWPYHLSPAEYEMTERPVLMGEFPPHGLSTAPYSDLVASFHEDGYAGALSWDFTGFHDEETGEIDAAGWTALENIRNVGENLGCQVDPRR